MKTSISEEKLIIISDLHIGNPFCFHKDDISDFLDWVVESDYSLCINGDWLEIAQTSFRKLAREAPELFAKLGRIHSSGKNLYYVVGNHDVVSEHFVEAWGGFQVVPFLNLESGGRRIRIEHGHLYDPFFVNHPVLYEFATEFAGVLLNFWPAAYKLWIKFEKMKSRLRAGPGINIESIEGESPSFRRAARELLDRGFDAVCFGHTHYSGLVDMGDGKQYVNSGTWLFSPSFVTVNAGSIKVHPWQRALINSVLG